MATPEQVRNSKAITRFQKDLEAYQKQTGKQTNEVLATKALDFSSKYGALLEKEAPKKESIPTGTAAGGHNVKVSRKIKKLIGAESDFKGTIKRKIKGKVTTNKRAWAVAQEIAKRKSSAGWLKKANPSWAKKINKNLEEGGQVFSEKFTRRRKKKVATAIGTFKKKKDRVVIRSEAFAFQKGQYDKGLVLATKAMEESSRGTRNYIAEQQGKLIAKEFKKAYK